MKSFPIRNGRKTILKYVIFFLIIFSTSYIINRRIFGIFTVVNSSMVPTLIPDARVVGFKMKKYDRINFGDIVIFRDQYSKHVIKRVIGIFGDTIVLRNNH